MKPTLNEKILSLSVEKYCMTTASKMFQQSMTYFVEKQNVPISDAIQLSQDKANILYNRIKCDYFTNFKNN